MSIDQDVVAANLSVVGGDVPDSSQRIIEVKTLLEAAPSKAPRRFDFDPTDRESRLHWAQGPTSGGLDEMYREAILDERTGTAFTVLMVCWTMEKMLT